MHTSSRRERERETEKMGVGKSCSVLLQQTKVASVKCENEELKKKLLHDLTRERRHAFYGMKEKNARNGSFFSRKQKQLSLFQNIIIIGVKLVRRSYVSTWKTSAFHQGGIWWPHCKEFLRGCEMGKTRLETFSVSLDFKFDYYRTS